MSLENISKEYFDKGVFVFENGKRLYIEEIQYSNDTVYWENTFIPYTHQDPRDAAATIQGHKYRRVRHAGDTNFQLPEYIVAEDGKTPIFKVEDFKLYVKYIEESDDSYTLLQDFEELRGIKGDTGADGRGWQIDLIGYWLEKPSILSPKSGYGQGGTFLSLGDGFHTITSSDVTSGLYYSTDGLLWVAIMLTDVGRDTRFTAIDSIGTGMVDYRDENYSNTRGKVYINYDSVWYYLFNVSIPMYKLSPTSAYFTSYEKGFYMEDYVGQSYILNPSDGHTIYLDSSFDLRVKEDSIEPKHFKDNSFGDGLDEGLNSVNGYKESAIVIKPVDFTGFGLSTYTSGIDSKKDIQVDTQVLYADGLEPYDDNLNQINGESRYKLNVKASDLVDVTLSGIETFTNSDGFLDFRAIVYNGLLLDTNGIGVKADELSITVLETDNEVKIKSYISGNDGILATHLNPTIVGDGLLQNITSKALEIYPDQTNNTVEVSSARGVFVPDNGIQGVHLNDDVCNETKGTKMVSDKITVLVDDSTIGIDGATGKLELKSGYLTNRAVTAITQGATVLRDLVAFEKIDTTYINTTVLLSASPNEVTISADLDLAALEAQLLVDGFVNVAGTYITGTSAFGGNSDSNIKSYVDSADALSIQFDTVYGNNIKLSATDGLLIKATDNTWRKLIITDNFGNLATTDSY